MEIISEQVKKFIGNKEILKGINIDVKNKEFLGIIGPNGSGKSTFLKCIYRILKPSEGKILFNGKNIDELSFRQTALDLAVVAQHNFYNCTNSNDIYLIFLDTESYFKFNAFR